MKGLARFLRIAGAAILFAFPMMAAIPSGAAAHAVLLATEPPDGAALGAAPHEIVLRFNEPVAPIFVRLFGPGGNAVSAPGPWRARDSDVRLPLPPDLAEGGYLVSYRVVSADAHPVSGSFAFAVGTAAYQAARPPDSAGARDDVWSAAIILLRWVRDAALMLAAGGAFFHALVLRGGPPVRGLNATIICGAAVAMIAAGLGMGIQGGRLAGAPASALAEFGTWRLGASTTAGTAALVMALSLALMALATVASSGLLARASAALGGLVAAASLALTGHSAAAGWVAQALLAVHAVTVAYWLGALWPLHTALRTRPPAEAAIIVRRFAAIGVPAVALLVVAGGATAIMRIGSLPALIGSDYGRILLLKLAVVALLLAVAVTNHRRLTPGLEANPKTPVRLMRNIRGELALAGAILLGTAVLAHTPPQDRATAHRQLDEATAGYTVRTASSGRTLRLEVAPARAGANTLTLRLSEENGRALAPLEIMVALSLPEAGIEPLTRVPEKTGEGRYTVPRLDLSVAGQWRVRVDALIGDFEKVSFTAELPIR